MIELLTRIFHAPRLAMEAVTTPRGAGNTPELCPYCDQRCSSDNDMCEDCDRDVRSL